MKKWSKNKLLLEKISGSWEGAEKQALVRETGSIDGRKREEGAQGKLKEHASDDLHISTVIC